MIDHKEWCTVLKTGTCNCRIGATEPKTTWLGATPLNHAPGCGVYLHTGNWAPYCTCYVKNIRYIDTTAAEAKPKYNPDPPDDIPSTIAPKPAITVPPWVWVLAGFGSGSMATYVLDRILGA